MTVKKNDLSGVSCLTEDDVQIVVNYIATNHEKITKPFQRYYRDTYGWGPQQLALICYLVQNEKLGMSKAAELVEISRQQATQLVSSLVEKGLITREHDTKNRRNIFIYPTELALKMLREGEAEYLKILAEQYKHHDVDDIRHILKIAAELTTFINAEFTGAE